MEELKHTIDLENYLVNDLKSEEDIKLYLNASLKDYLEDGDFNSFYRALEIVIKTKDSTKYQKLSIYLMLEILFHTTECVMRKVLHCKKE